MDVIKRTNRKFDEPSRNIAMDYLLVHVSNDYFSFAF